MSETQERELMSTVQQLVRLRESVEDLEDAKDLDAAIARNGEGPLVPWEQAKNELVVCVRILERYECGVCGAAWHPARRLSTGASLP
jgi:hypothetical protein